MLVALRSLLTVCCLFAAACSMTSTRLASSLPLAENSSATLRIQCFDARDIAVKLWNRGPGRITFVTSDALVRGELLPGSGDLDWRLHAEDISIQLLTGAEPATVAYTIRTRGGLEVTVER